MPDFHEQPLVSVVVPTRDRPALLARAVGTALAQEDVRLEILVVDDGSTDAVSPALERLGDSRLKVLRLHAPGGAAAARNRGIAAAAGEWVAFLDDDDVWAPNKLRKQLAALAGSNAVLCYSGAVYIDEAGRPLRIRRLPDPAELPQGILRTNLVGGPSTVIVRADALRQLGGFDERLNVLADWDMWIRLLDIGPAAACPDVLAGYRIHGANMHQRDVERIRAERDYLRRKHGARAKRLRTRVAGTEFSLWLVARYRAAGRRRDAAREYVGIALSRRSPRHLARAAAMLARRSIALSNPAVELAPSGPRWPGVVPLSTTTVRDAPRVSVVVAARNEEHRLPCLLETLRRQSLSRADYEVIVVDDGSSDATAAIAAAGQDVVVVRAPRHVGLAAARNLGVRSARAPVIAFTDADCVPSPQWLERGLAHFETFPVDIMGGSITIALDRITGSALVDAIAHLKQERYVERGFAAGANLWLRRDLIQHLGGFDERLGMYGEEEELCQRATRLGARIVYAEDVHVDHPARSSAGALARKAFLLGTGLAAHRRLNEGTLGSVRRLFADPRELVPQRRLQGLEDLRRRGVRLSPLLLARMYLAQQFCLVWPKVFGDLIGELRMALRLQPRVLATTPRALEQAEATPIGDDRELSQFSCL